jgi:hypothetical protein
VVKTKPKRTDHPSPDFIVGLGGVLHPASAYDQELIVTRYAVGARVTAPGGLWQNRSVPHHRKYWGILGQCVSNSENKYGRTYDLHQALKMALGYVHRFKLLLPSAHAKAAMAIKQCVYRARELLADMKGPHEQAIAAFLSTAIEQAAQLENDLETCTIPASTAFDAMDQGDFKIYYEQAMTQLRVAGYPINEIEKEVQKDLAPIKVRLTEPQPAPYHGEANVPQSKAVAKPPPPETDRVPKHENSVSFQERSGLPGSLDGYGDHAA